MKFEFFLFQTNQKYEISDRVELSDTIKIVQVGEPPEGFHYDYIDTSGTCETNRSQYGNAAGLYWVWKNTSLDYYGFSLTNHVPDISAQQYEEFCSSGKNVLIIEPKGSYATIQENYRSRYYGYDFRMLMSILKKYYNPYYEYAKDYYIDDHYFTMPCAIMKKDFFQKYCAWSFQILNRCEHILSAKYSDFQNLYLEHLSYYLLGLYIGYNKKSAKPEYVKEACELPLVPAKVEEPSFTLSGSELCKKYYKERRIEKLEAFLDKNAENEALNGYRKVMERYSRERRYYKTTILEGSNDLDELVSANSAKVKEASQKVLIIQWNSVSNDETVLAFDTLGLEHDSFRAGDIKKAKGEAFLDQINRHLDFYSYAFVFSINYFPSVAEACFTHETPYIAWTYDSPISIPNRNVANYPTTHIFVFDSNECEYFKRQGIQNIRYVPLAVNVDKYDHMVCTPEEVKKYEASVSFVGSLYATKLTEAMKYLPDYQKGFLNALTDNILYTRNYDLLDGLRQKELMELLDNKKFNKIVNTEWDVLENNLEDTVAFGRFKTLLLKNVTNRERLILISMLSNHWDFKLYSHSTHEVFKSTIECGTVNYYTEMPKVFKCSKINMNMTLRTIQTGIPLRCLDIMGCHATLLTNHQKDFDEYFKDGESLIMYDTFEEAYDKVDFYLRNDTLRQKITDRGYEIVKEHFNYPTLMKEVIKMSDLGSLLEGK